jgi:hypothetical protein
MTYIRTAEHREKMSLVLKEKFYSDAKFRHKMKRVSACNAKDPKRRVKISLALQGHKCSSETRAKMSEAMRKRWKDISYQQKMSTLHKGKIISNETRALIGKFWHGRKHSVQTLEKMRKSALDRAANPEYRKTLREMSHKARSSASMKPNKVECRVGKYLDTLFPGQWKYTGGGPTAKSIGGKYPDFIHSFLPIVLEVFGRYWHKISDGSKRRKHFLRYGYTTIVVWEEDCIAIESFYPKLPKLLDF